MTFRAKVKPCAATLVAAVVIAGSGSVAVRELAAGEPGSAGAAAGKPAANEERKGPLAALPSAPGEHIAKIKTLGPGQWLKLGAPAADPKWGRALGCAWGGKSMVLAPELRGAFRAGEGWHAHVKPDGFGQDDYWFYDINAHRWICLYPGTDTRNFNRLVKEGALKVDDVGRVVDPSGQPIPGHLLIHAFGCLDYDADMKKLIILRMNNGFGRYFMPGLKNNEGRIDEGMTQLEKQGLNKKGKGPNFGPWAYNTQTGRFEHDPAANAWPDVGEVWPVVLYIPSRKEYFVAGGRGVVFFNPATRTWGALVPKTESPGSWSLGCYDSKRDRVYGGCKKLFCYDVKTGLLTGIEGSTEVEQNYSNNIGALVYDAANDRVLHFVFRGDRKGLVVPLDPETNRWGAAIPFDPAFKIGQTNAGFYDPELGVVFIYSAGDSRDDGVMWVYKSKGRAAAGK